MSIEGFLTTHQLLAARAQHMDNINLLHRASTSWNEAQAERGADTIANLTQQIEALDVELNMAKRRKAGAA